ncbi:MAG: hypothetical protein CMO44_12995 [Verrucomicrobiales bacterium]|nr:hypothetical protein [Verrucomicrobiales bacterium]|tara:strand:- start:24173 stop:24502 length:330 start_codon:yes stop_codon:yes gene_type:complete
MELTETVSNDTYGTTVITPRPDEQTSSTSSTSSDQGESSEFLTTEFISSYSRFGVQFILSGAVIVFSCCMIWRNPEKDNSVQYSLMSSILGFWMPSPHSPKKKKTKKIT